MTIASEMNDRLAFVREFAPSLVCLRAALAPFEDVIVSQYAGPQPQATDYDPDEEPYFCVEVNCPMYKSCTVALRFTADEITYQEWMVIGSGKKRQEVPGDEPQAITLDGVFSFLRQLPRPVSSF
jgi:hypothetical protein